MCLPVPMLIGLAVSAVGSFGTAYMSSAMAKQQALIEQRQLRTEIENEKIKAITDTNNRLEQFRKDEAANRAALSTLGFDNMSYSQGIVPANKKVVSRDVRAIDYNAGQEVGRKKYEIAVAGWRAKSEGVKGYVEAGAQTIGKLGSDLYESKT